MKRTAILLIGLLILLQLTSCSFGSGSGSSAEPIAMVKYFGQQQEWDDEVLLAVSEYTGAVLSDESKKAYPELAEILEQTKNMAKRTMEDEYDNLLATAKEELSIAGAKNFRTKSSTLDVQIRRADSVAVSLLSDSELVFGQINGRFIHGTTYDTETGNELKLTDVMTDTSKLAEIVKAELRSHTWTGDFSSDTAVEDYFANTPEDGLSWTLDYNGVTLYFANGDIAELGDGRLAVTVSFKEYPELFEAKYMAVPKSHITELPLDHPFYADIDNDGLLEELNVSPFMDESGLFYSSYGIYTDTEAQYYQADVQANTTNLTGGYNVY
nr:hypothetical protein [Clostridia bacterium]